ncbi:MAG: GIY-YIG nuclease family protein [Henriciella sp.]
MRDHNYFVYILASRRNGTLYTGITNDLARRMWEHKTGYIKGFAHKYGVKNLVWFEHHTDVDFAITREKRIKRWRRAWKLNLIENENPEWIDLYPSLLAA